MKLGLHLAFILTFTLSAWSQSGRVKPTESPSPTPVIRPTVIYVPTQVPSVEKTLPLPKASPTPKSIGDAEQAITVDSTLVPIPVSAVDSNGRAITNLRLNDFELKIDGKTVEIGELTRAETPIRLAMLFDNSSSVLIAREFEKAAAIKFFRRVLRPEKDMAALFSVSTVTRLEQRLTSDIFSLIRAIELFPPPEGATALLDGIVYAAEYLGEVPGRRVIVIVSDGDDTVSDSTLEKAMRWLQFTNVQVYVVKTTDFENYKRTGLRGGNANIRQLAAERRMQEVTTQTGGAVYSPIDERELDDAFRQISAELAQQYVLSYYPENDAEKRGEFRQISLAVKTRQNVTVRTRKGYYVPKK